MSKRGRKRRARKKSGANHGSGPTPDRAAVRGQRVRSALSRSGGGGALLRVRDQFARHRSTLTCVPSSSKETLVSCSLMRSRRPEGGRPRRSGGGPAP